MESDDEKRKKFKQRLEKHEARQEAERRQKFKAFNIDEFVADADKLLEVEVPELEVTVKYKQLTNIDFLQAMKVKDDQEKGLEILYYLLSRADPNVTREKIKAMNPLKTARILAAITSKTPIFLM